MLRAETTEQIVEAVRTAAAAARVLDIHGGGTKLSFLRPVDTTHVLDVANVGGIDNYEPDELVITLRPGTRLAEVEEALFKRGQMLAFEPPDLGPLFGAAAQQGTIGGVVACNLSGPRRIHAGGARDHVLGLEAVNGWGEVFRAGGRVVKNVTGYDLMKLLTGSWGTLAVLTELTLKVLPMPQRQRTLVMPVVDAPAAVALLTAAMGSANEVSAAALLPPALAVEFQLPMLGVPVALLRVDGFAPSVIARADVLAGTMPTCSPVSVLEDEPSLRLWREIRDLAPFVVRRELLLWRLSVPPTAGPGLAQALEDRCGAVCLVDWGGGAFVGWDRARSGRTRRRSSACTGAIGGG